VKKSAYSAAAVTVLGTGVGLAAGPSGLVSRIKEVVWDIAVVVTMKSGETDAQAKNRGEIQWPFNRVPSASVFKNNTSDEDPAYKDNMKTHEEPDVVPNDDDVASSRRWFDTDYILVSTSSTLKAGFPVAGNNDAMNIPANWTKVGNVWTCKFKTYVTYQWS